MKSRLPPPDDKERIIISNTSMKPEKKSKKTKAVMLHKKSKQKITQSEIQLIQKLSMQRSNTDDDDIYGRMNMAACLSNGLQKHTWPLLNQNTICSQSNDQRISTYKNKANDMLSEYINTLIQESDMKPVSALKEYPLFDITTYNDIVNESTSKFSNSINVEFNDEEKYIIRNGGLKIFDTGFDNFFIKINKCRYAYVEIKKQDMNVELNIQIYIGSNKEWIVHMTSHIILKFKDKTSFAFDIEQISGEIYEQILLKHIDKTNWSKEYKTMWSDIFCIPYDKNNMIISLVNEQEKDNEPCLYVAHSQPEANIMRKIYEKDYIKTYSSKKDIEKAVKILSCKICLPEIIQMLSMIYLNKTLQNNNPITIEEKDGRVYQRYNSLIVSYKK